MSDIHPHSRPDLDLLPCDCEPPVNLALFDPHLRDKCPECGHGTICSPQLCSRRRMMHLKQRLEASARLVDRPEPHGSVVVELATERAIRSRRKG